MNSHNVSGAPSFSHLQAMTDSQGLFEHALHTRPRVEHGYCVDDVARGLVVTVREPRPNAVADTLSECYLDFVIESVAPDGRVRNRKAANGVWLSDPSTEDCWGRALWGLGTAAAKAPTATMRARAMFAFRRAAEQRSPHLMSMTFAALGAAEVLKANPNDESAAALLRDFVVTVGDVDPLATWPWPEPRLRYSNGHVSQALISAGALLAQPETLANGLALLQFLLDTETLDGHLSPTPVGGRGPADIRPGFDQQPIEPAALADACTTALEVSRDDKWSWGIELAWRWFLGENDARVPMVDPRTGAGFDGLERDGRNDNCGAESTIAALSTAQHARSARVPVW